MREDEEESVTSENTDEAASDEVMSGEDEEVADLTADADGEDVMREMIDYIAKVLVEDKDSVQVDSTWRDDRLIVNLKVAEADKGKVIGRNGRVVQAMQSLLRVAATKSNLRVNLDVE